MLKTLWEWWIEGLLAPLPAGLRRWLRGARRPVWAHEREDGLEFVVRRGGAWKTLWKDSAQHAMPTGVRRRLRAADIIVQLPERCILRRNVSIPRDASPAAYVHQRLDELSPFPESETCFDVINEPDAPGSELVMTRRQEIQERLDRLRGIGLRARGVGVENLEHTPLNLLPPDCEVPARRDPTGMLMVAAGLLACGAVLAVPFADQSRALRNLTAQKERLERHLARAGDTRERILQLRARAAEIAERGMSGPGAVGLLAEVTGAVPDHSWVRQLVLYDGELTLQGESDDTADLIARLEASPSLENVRYDAAITHDAGSGTDRFKLTADTRRDGS